MTEDEALAAIEAYDKILALALERAAEWGRFVGYPESARVYINEDGEVVIQSFRPADDGYGAPLLDEETETFPLAFLLAGEDERSSMLTAEKARRQAETDAWYARADREREAQERAAYEALKRKFG
jgi:hypothetical protein